MLDDSVFDYLLPHQPWIFLGGVMLLVVVAMQSVIFLTPYRIALRDSRPWRFVRVGTASVLGLYALLALLALVLFAAAVVLAGHGSSRDVTSFAVHFLLSATGLVCVIVLLVFWALGSRFASVVLLLALLVSSAYLVRNRVSAICEPLALAGLSRAQLCMAELSSFKTPGSHKKAYYSRHSSKDWYEMAAAGGNPQAAFLMGVRHRDEKLLRTAVEGGELRAAVHLAGVLPAESRSDGIHWVRQAAEQGIPDAMAYLGQLHFHGRDVEQDVPKAMDYFGKAAGAGELSAMWFMAVQYAKGNPVLAKDADLSRDWESRALARERALVEYEAKLRSTYNFEVRPDVMQMKLERLHMLDTLQKTRK